MCLCSHTTSTKGPIFITFSIKITLGRLIWLEDKRGKGAEEADPLLTHSATNVSYNFKLLVKGAGSSFAQVLKNVKGDLPTARIMTGIETGLYLSYTEAEGKGKKKI